MAELNTALDRSCRAATGNTGRSAHRQYHRHTPRNPTDNDHASAAVPPTKRISASTRRSRCRRTAPWSPTTLTTFLNESIAGGAVTAYDMSGSPVNIQLRWAKTDSARRSAPAIPIPGTCSISPIPTATGTQPAWTNAGANYTFGANGQLDPAVIQPDAGQCDGRRRFARQRVHASHGSGGLTQFADPNGNVQVNLLQQNGFAAGSLQTVAVSDKGRIVGTYSNGRTIDLAEITLANFNGANFLKRIDGGAFEVTDESGPPTYSAPGTDRRFLARGLQHRHRRRIHQADRDPAGLFGQHARDHDQQPDGSGPPEHAAVAACEAQALETHAQGGESDEPEPGPQCRGFRLASHAGRHGAGRGQRRQCRDARLRPQDARSGRDRGRHRRRQRARRRHQPRARSVTCSASCRSKSSGGAYADLGRSSTVACRRSTARPARRARWKRSTTISPLRCRRCRPARMTRRRAPGASAPRRCWRSSSTA